MNLDHLTDETLLTDIKKISEQVKSLTLKLLYHLREVDLRVAYSLLNYPSLFAYCRGELGLSEQESWARIGAMRTLGKVKGIEERIQNQQLTLTQVGQLGSFLNQNIFDVKDEKKTNEILKMIEGKSTRETKKILDEQAGRREPEMVQIKISRELYGKLNRLKDKWQRFSDEDILRFLCDEMSVSERSRSNDKCENGDILKEKKNDLKDKERKAEVEQEIIARKPHSRYIPVKLKKKIIKKSGHQCEFISPLNGERCQEKNRLQVHHLIPFAVGGATRESNTELRCWVHNFRAGVEFFGKNKMNQFKKDASHRLRKCDVR